jgi:putative ABC transport system permease protein
VLSQMLVKVLTGVFDPPPTALTVPWGYLTLTIGLVAGTLVLASVGAVQVARRPAISVLRRL